MDKFSNNNTQWGIITIWLRYDPLRGWYDEFPLMNWGTRQSDAIEYKYHDCPNLTPEQLTLAARNFNIKHTFQREAFRKYRRTHDEVFVGEAARTLKQAKI